ncbi:hypothetical protein OO015_10455 [Thermomicrobium sp. 4228-Ro]|uniref:hypothetical protein n=1 Tax=Thermomicrobium sp. 4228-Ro TaxID=2993937 RepID=UPI002248CA7E|nr:hypothetical protein [Thermomicrobium sp. 4228-Ro]MCX2727909.1 hypothetical protein [Thermomicrobium sp. 4228-Ro]
MQDALSFFIRLLLLVALPIGCSTAQPALDHPKPTPTSPPASVLTPDTNEIRFRPEPIIGQLVLATQIGEDEAPRDERASVPVGTERLYLVVRVSDFPAGSTLVAVWTRGTNEIGRSERKVDEAIRGSRWVALTFPQAGSLSGGEYAVRLYLDDRFIDSLVFSVGGGSGTTGGQQATLVFTDALPADGSQVHALDVFPEGTTRVIAVLVDVPPDLQADLWSRWTIDGQILTESGADELRFPFVRTFTLEREEPLPAGTYTVEIFADQQSIARGTFRIAGANPTPSPAEIQASVEDVRLVRAVEPGTGVPVGAALREVQAPARIYIAILVHNLQPSDVLEVIWQRAGVEISRQPLRGLALSSNWIALPVELPAETGPEPVPYSVIVVLNGETVAQRSLVVHP